MNICLVGPTYPFRGGIAHHTTLLYRTLRQQHNVRFYAFKRQYPGWIFPGRSDIDTSGTSIDEPGAIKLLDSVNPFSWIRVAIRIEKDDPDLVIIPWWVSFWTPQFWTIASWLRMRSNAKILFICHNVYSHESRWIDGFCRKLVLPKGDFFLTHSEQDRTYLQHILPHARIKKVFHPIYDMFDSGQYTREKARRKLDLRAEEHTLLFFGFIRPYKGLTCLIDAMPSILQKVDVTLLIVGEFWKGKEEILKRIGDLGIEDHVRIVDEYVPNEEVESFFAACDAVVLPYLRGTGSGIAQVAISFDKPIIATRIGSLPEIVVDGRTGFIVEPGNIDELAMAVTRFFREDMGADFSCRMRKRKTIFSWDKMNETVEEIHKELIENSDGDTLGDDNS